MTAIQTTETPVPAQRRVRTRSEHLMWVRARAIEQLDLSGDPYRAFCQLYDDLPKHPLTENHPAIQIASMQMIEGTLRTAADMRLFIGKYVR